MAHGSKRVNTSENGFTEITKESKRCAYADHCAMQSNISHSTSSIVIIAM